MSTLALASGPSIAVEPTGSDAAAWLRDYFGPALTPGAGAPEWVLQIKESDAALRRMRGEIPKDAELRPCFTSDRHLIELRTHRTPNATLVDDTRRRCAMRLSPPTLEVAGEEGTGRWRIVPAFVVSELTAARLRHSHVELPAAGVEVDGAGIAILGPKGAGKTTLSLAFLCTGRCRHVCNDRAFARIEADGPLLRSMPTAVTLPGHLTKLLPQLELDDHWTDRPYLYTLDELLASPGSRRPPSVELWLGPHQLAGRLGVERTGTANLRVLLFPRFGRTTKGWRLAPVPVEQVPRRLLENVFGDAVRPRQATIFEALDGGVTDPPTGVVEELGRAVPAFSLDFGPDASASESFPEDLLDALGVR